jgi:5-methyltetrahydrofolate--homocysteine methyltransferase
MDWKKNWPATKQRFEAWWNGDLSETPLMSLVIRKEPSLPYPTGYDNSPQGSRLDAEGILARFRYQMGQSEYAADAYPNLSADLGPGSLALYLGSEPVFAEDTVWFKECAMDTWENFPLRYDGENRWWKAHFELLKTLREKAGDEFYINMPDLVENIDILAALRGNTPTLYDLIDEPELMKRKLEELDALYFQYFNPIYDMIKDEGGGNSYTAFQVWGPGKTAKLQCDYNAVMSPEQFAFYICPSLEAQCQALDYSLFHLDGPDTIKHLPALMEVKSLKALQWTSGVNQPDGSDKKWDIVYDQAQAAGKSLWVNLGYDIQDGHTLTEKARRLVKRYGIKSLYMLFPPVSAEDGKIILKAAAKGFR